ncbi:hypothetical protein ACVWYH_006003 [Bradyrhizobium sp. GM24.11]
MCNFDTSDPIKREVSLNDTPPLHARFIVRRGSIAWMVYDRVSKGPAQLEKGGPFAEKLTKEQAERIKQTLTDVLSKQVPR